VRAVGLGRPVSGFPGTTVCKASAQKEEEFFGGAALLSARRKSQMLAAWNARVAK